MYFLAKSFCQVNLSCEQLAANKLTMKLATRVNMPIDRQTDTALAKKKLSQVKLKLAYS